MTVHPVQQLNQWSLWAETNPAKCPCKGSGWLLSDYDTWHPCGLHGGTPHPESDEPFDREAHALKIRRDAFAAFKAAADVPNFIALCRVRLPEEPTPQDWVNAADEVSFELVQARREREAQAQGYSCDFERRMAEEAELEAVERGGL